MGSKRRLEQSLRKQSCCDSHHDTKYRRLQTMTPAKDASKAWASAGDNAPGCGWPTWPRHFGWHADACWAVNKRSPIQPSIRGAKCVALAGRQRPCATVADARRWPRDYMCEHPPMHGTQVPALLLISYCELVGRSCIRGAVAALLPMR